MLKAFTYEPKDVGLAHWPEGILRLANTEPVVDPEQADIFIMPASLMTFRESSGIHQIRTLPYMQGREEWHVFFDVSDFDQVYNLRCLFIRCNLKAIMRKADINSIPWAWPVDDYGDIAPVLPEGFQYDVSFHGWLSCPARTDSVASVASCADLEFDYSGYTDFYGYVHRDNRPEADRRMAAYKHSLQRSRMALCGRSILGVFPYRFFEAMSAARVPILFCDEYNLPWQREIDWDRCTLRYPEHLANKAGTIIRDFLVKTSDQELIERGKYGREMWLRYLNRNQWPELMTEAVELKLKELGLYSGAR